jgi:uncharacterized protein YjbI with pentapeptide repeats
MKASEVLHRYGNGKRDFCHADLRGQSFQGADLSGADFSEAKIQGTNFTNAILKNAKFIGATAGVQPHWQVIQLLLVFALSALAGVLQGYFGYYIALYFPYVWDADYNWKYFSTDIAVSIGYLITLTATFLAIIRQGFTVKAFSTIAVAVAVAVAVAGAGAGAGAGAVAVAVAGAGAGAGAVAVAVAGAGAGAGLGFYVAHRVKKGDEKFALIRSFGIAFGALGGTNFRHANLTGANFSRATLKSSDFRAANLTHVCWHNAQTLDRARVGDSILATVAVRQLLVTRNGYKKSYVDANFQGANLSGVNLNKANLRRANLSEAILHEANLQDANLREVLAVDTDFTKAVLTGARLEAWNIDHTTTLKDVDCQYVFFLEQPNQLGSRERRPHEPDQVFAAGEFEKLYTKMINVVQVLLRNGMKNQAAFNAAFQAFLAEHPAISRNAIQSVERKGDDALVTLEVEPTADKAEISRGLRQAYEDKVRRLEAKVEKLHELHAADLKEVALAQKTQIFSQLVEGNAVQESTDSSRKIQIGDIGGDFNASGQALNLGDMSGTVTNSISQLQQSTTPKASELAAALKELQIAIESEPTLPPDDKAEALEQVGKLAKAGENPKTAR